MSNSILSGTDVLFSDRLAQAAMSRVARAVVVVVGRVHTQDSRVDILPMPHEEGDEDHRYYEKTPETLGYLHHLILYGHGESREGLNSSLRYFFCQRSYRRGPCFEYAPIGVVSDQSFAGL